MQNYYDLLNVSSTATFEDLKRSYKQIILQCHPDKLQQQQQKQDEVKDTKATKISEPEYHHIVDLNLNDDTDNDEAKQHKKFLKINEAWNTLKDPVKRKHYDAELLQNKFQTHSNIYDTITLTDMRREAVLEELEEDHDQSEESKSSEANHAADKELAATSECASTIYYVYDCRCGGQYALDESAAIEMLHNNDNLHQRPHNHQAQQHQHQQLKSQPRLERQRQSQRQQQQPNPQKTSVNASDEDSLRHDDKIDNDDCDSIAGERLQDDVDEVMVECNECSLVIIVKPQINK